MSRNRRQTQASPEVMYIGFERPKPRNGLGVAGFIVSLCSLLTCGLFSPIGLLLSLVALRKGPRGMATAGTLLGLIGMVPWAVAGLSIQADIAQRADREARRELAAATQHTEKQLRVVLEKLEDHRAEHGTYPAGIEGNKLAVPHTDGWNTSLRYEIHDNSIIVRSAGPDAEFESADDLTKVRPTSDTLQHLSMR